MDFPTCRHGKAAESPSLRHCRSPKLAGLKIVSAAQCHKCYCRDHELTDDVERQLTHLLPCAFLGELLPAAAAPLNAPIQDSRSTTAEQGGDFRCHHPLHRRTTPANCQTCADYLFPVVTPNMPVEMVRRLLTLPPREQSADWWRWENVQAAHRLAADTAIEQTPELPPRFSGRGIVVVGGGRYFVSAYVTIRVLRQVGSQLPIELWHLDGEIDARMQALVAPYGVTCVNADEVALREPYRFLPGNWWRGWQLKAFALRNCSFREVLLLDADSYPVRNPDVLFDWPRYREWGAIFWPDLEHSKGMIAENAWSVFGAAPFTDLPTESGQILVHKELCWRELNLALHYNAHADFVYRLLYGDKDTFPMAWQRLGRRYARMWPTAFFDSVALHQLDDRGQLLFIHRVRDKFRLPEAAFESTPQNFERNKYQNHFPLEKFCFGVVAELAGGNF